VPLPTYIEVCPEGVRLRLKVQPRASKNDLAGVAGDELKIRVTAPPVDAAANQAVLDLLADLLECRRGAVQLIRGQTARHKIVLVAEPGLDATAIQTRLERHLA
jgi:uncharacterized protein (TIGR00251 family)